MAANRRVTLKDIAKKTGYTVNTVSRALNDKNDISESAKKLIKETAEQLGYINDNMAGSLRSGRTKTIAVILSDISNPHLAYQVKLIELTAIEYGYNTIILNTDENSDYERRAIVSAYEKRVDGILICPVQENEDNIRFLQSLNIPFVLIGRYFKNIDADAVLCDDVRSGYLAARFLLDKGYNRILYLGVPTYLSPGQERLDGYKNACVEAGIQPDSELINCINVKTGDGEKIIGEISKKNIRFDSVIVFSDMLAYEIMYALTSLYGPRAEGIPVVGFDGIQSHLPLPIKYTSVGMNKDGWAKQSLKLLFGKIQDTDNSLPHQRIILDVEVLSFT